MNTKRILLGLDGSQMEWSPDAAQMYEKKSTEKDTTGRTKNKKRSWDGTNTASDT